MPNDSMLPHDPENNNNLPMAPETTAFDEDDGIFMSWPGGDTATFDASEANDTSEDANDTPKEKETDAPEQKAKKKKAKSGKKKADDGTKQSEHAEYAFRRASRSDMEESAPRKKKKADAHDETDNEATLSSIKYYKYTKKLKQLVVHRVLPISLALFLIIGFVLYFFRLQHLNFVNLSGYDAAEVFSATGIKKNDLIFTVTSSDIEEKLRTKFPYIQGVKVEHDLPDTVNLVFEEDCALFYTQIYDEYFVISESLRVLARYDSTDDLDTGLRSVKLSSVSFAVVGHPLKFFDASYLSFLRAFIASMEASDIYENITAMDISNRFDLVITYDDRLQIFLGNDTYLDSNLSFAKCIVDELEDDDRGEINIIDNKTASFSAQTNQ